MHTRTHAILLLTMIALACAVAVFFFEPKMSYGTNMMQLCYQDGCVDFSIVVTSASDPWIFQPQSAVSLMSTLERHAIKGHGIASEQYSPIGLITQLSCDNGAVFTAHYNTCPDSSLAPNGDTSQCTCAHGNTSACTDGTCPIGYTLQNGQCVLVSCPAGYTLQGGQCVWTQCQVGYMKQNGQCVFSACPAGFVQVGQQCVPEGGQCSPPFVCHGGDLYQRSGSSCAEAFYQHCAYGCSGNACSPTPPPLLVTWNVRPLLVQENSSVYITWGAHNVASCTVSGTNGDGWSGASGDKISSPIKSQTTYSILCNALAGANPSTISLSTIVNIIPEFIEK